MSMAGGSGGFEDALNGEHEALEFGALLWPLNPENFPIARR